LEKIDYTPAFSSGSGQGSDQSLSDRLRSSAESSINELEVLIREHVQNSRDAFEKRENKPEKLIFKVTRKKLHFGFAKLDRLNRIIGDCIKHKENQIDKEYQDGNDALVKLRETSKKIEARKGDQLWSVVIEDNGIGLDGISRFSNAGERKTGTVQILDEGDSNKHDASYGGAFGVGKLTAFTNNDLYTVFYLTQQGNDIRAIGKTKIESYTDNEGRPCGPDIFFGKISTHKSLGFECSDWFITDESLRKIRSIEDNGLTTVIPSLKNPDDNDWSKKVAYAIVHSYFKLFKNNQINVVIEDQYLNEVIEVNFHNYKEVYAECEKLDYLNQKENLLDKYNYNLIKPFVLGEEKFMYKKFEKDFEVTKKYSGKAILNVYHNPYLVDLIDEMGRKNLKQTFRYIRGGMLLRSELLPRRQVFDASFCGYVEFDEKYGKYLNEILRSGETQSHDKLDRNTYDRITVEGFPGYSTINQKLFVPLSSWIREIVDDLSSLSSNDGDEYELEFDFLDGFNAENLNPTFDRNFISDELLEKIRDRNLSGITSKGKTSLQGKADNENASNNTDEGVIIDGGTTLGEKGHKEGEGTKPNEPKEGGKNGGLKGQGESFLESISFMSKIIEKNDRFHKYAIKLSNVIDKIDIEISQESTLRNSFLSFEIQNIMINGVAHPNFIRQTTSGGLVTGYRLKDVEPLSELILIELSVYEPSKTESRFNLILS